MGEPIEFAGKHCAVEQSTEPQPRLLRIPDYCQIVADLLGTAVKIEDLTGAVFIGQLANGRLVYLNSNLTAERANWLLDQAKQIVIGPGPERVPGTDRSA
jgi:hypothetical protein